LAADPGLRARLGAAARDELLRRNYTWSGNATRIIELAARAEPGFARAPSRLPV
jgi:hypothetical protein